MIYLQVTGYVLISHVDVTRIVLPSLQIVRGRTLFKLNRDDDAYALIVTLSKMHNLEMPALRGTVIIFFVGNATCVIHDMVVKFISLAFIFQTYCQGVLEYLTIITYVISKLLNGKMK
jgi:hypothetical protein